jgi:hypothetical protein
VPDIQAAASIRRFPIEGGLLLLDSSSKRLLAFNDAARHVWDLVAAGRSNEDLVSEFAAWWGLPASRAAADVSSILAQWRDLGLLAGYERPPVPLRSVPLAAVDSCRASQPQSASQWTCTIRGKAIKFAVGDEVAPSIRLLFKHLETPSAQPQARLEIATAPGNEMLLIDDGIERIRTSDFGQLVGALYQAVLRHLNPDVIWLGLIHGAALARNGAGVGLAGPSGSGKSTLAAGLLNAGFDFLADDMIALSAPDGTIMPWPLPLSIKPGSIDVVAARHPNLAQAARYRTKGLDARLLVPPASVWDSGPVRLKTLVFPRFIAGAAADLQRISSFDAVARLLADRIWLGYPITEVRVAAFLTWLNDTPTYALIYGGLDDGVRQIEGVVG